MCNGTGSVIARPTRRIRSRKDYKKKSNHRTNSQDLFDISKVSYQVYSRLNKNEFQVFYKGIIKHLASYDFRRAAASFNYLVELTIGSEQEPEQRLHSELFNVKKNLLDEIIDIYQDKEVMHVSSKNYSDKISKLEKIFQDIYKKYFLETENE